MTFLKLPSQPSGVGSRRHLSVVSLHSSTTGKRGSPGTAPNASIITNIITTCDNQADTPTQSRAPCPRKYLARIPMGRWAGSSSAVEQQAADGELLGQAGDACVGEQRGEAERDALH